MGYQIIIGRKINELNPSSEDVYNQAKLLNAEYTDTGEADITIEDQKNGDIITLTISNASALLGNHKEFFDEEFFKEASGEDSAEILRRLLDVSNTANDEKISDRHIEHGKRFRYHTRVRS